MEFLLLPEITSGVHHAFHIFTAKVAKHRTTFFYYSPASSSEVILRQVIERYICILVGVDIILGMEGDQATTMGGCADLVRYMDYGAVLILNPCFECIFLQTQLRFSERKTHPRYMVPEK